MANVKGLFKQLLSLEEVPEFQPLPYPGRLNKALPGELEHVWKVKTPVVVAEGAPCDYRWKARTRSLVSQRSQADVFRRDTSCARWQVSCIHAYIHTPSCITARASDA